MCVVTPLTWNAIYSQWTDCSTIVTETFRDFHCSMCSYGCKYVFATWHPFWAEQRSGLNGCLQCRCYEGVHSEIFYMTRILFWLNFYEMCTEPILVMNHSIIFCCVCREEVTSSCLFWSSSIKATVLQAFWVLFGKGQNRSIICSKCRYQFNL